MNDDGYTIFCGRCGAEMNSNSRYCMKCGYLNPEHEANQSMQKFMPKEEAHRVGEQSFVAQNEVSTQPVIGLANNSGNHVACFLVNLFCYLGIIGFLFYLVYQMDPTKLNTILYSFFPIGCVVITLLYLFHYSVQLLFMKCNERWWKAWIPIYGIIVLINLGFQSKKKGYLFLIPVVGIVVLIIALYRLGELFNYSPFLSAVLPIIFIPLMGYGSHFYGKNQYVSSTDSKIVERNFLFQKILYRMFIGFIVLGAGLWVVANFTLVKTKGRQLENYYYVYAGKKYVKKTDSMIKEKKVVCDYVKFNGTSGVYYFFSYNVRDEVYLPFSYFREPIMAYVMVDITSGTPKYYVSVSDGTNGYPETAYEDLSMEIPGPYEDIVFDSHAYNVCYFDE